MNSKWLLSGIALALAIISYQGSALAEPITLSGVVKNSSGKPIGGAQVELIKAKISVGTDSEGKFLFKSLSSKTPTLKTIEGVHFTAVPNGIILTTSGNISSAKIRVCELSGKTVFEQSSSVKQRSLKFDFGGSSLLSNQTYILQATIDGAEHTQMLPAFGTSNKSITRSKANPSLLGKSAAVAIDTIRVSMGGVKESFPVSSYTESNLSLTLAYEISTIPALPSKTIAEQNAAKQFFKSLNADLCGFMHKDHDLNKDVIGFIISSQNSKIGVMTDEHIKRLKDFPKLQSVWIQNQKLSDTGIAVLSSFPDLIEVRFHYMKNDTLAKLTPPIKPPSAQFLKYINVHRNLRVLEIKHCFGMEKATGIDMKVLDGFPNIIRIVLDQGATSNEGMAFVRKCPSVKDLSWHRGEMTYDEFKKTVSVLPNLMHLGCRGQSGTIPADYLSGLTGHKALSSLWVADIQLGALKANPNFLMPLKDVTTFKTVYYAEGDTKYVSNFLNVRTDVKVVASGQYIDMGYVFPPKSDLNKVAGESFKSILDDSKVQY